MSWNSLFTLLNTWRLRVRTRCDIAQLDRATVADLGVSASQMKFEAQKPFWRA